MTSSYKAAGDAFASPLDASDYFESLSAQSCRTTLEAQLRSPDNAPVFLLGEPGVGKTYMLHLLKQSLEAERRVILSCEPFETPESLLRYLLEAFGETSEGSLPALKERCIALYAEHPHVIMLDEAQLFNGSVLEYLRVLADSGAFKLLLSMHLHDGEQILKKPHFASREKQTVRMGTLQRDEVSHFLTTRLTRHGQAEHAALITPKVSKTLFGHTRGNFRLVKRYARTMFTLMDHAKNNGMARYSKPNRCIMTMSAIELGLIDG